MPDDKNKKARIGRLGEDLACRYLESKGFLTLERNYRKKWGEIDIILKKSGKLHFVEVKAVTRPPGSLSIWTGESLESVSREMDTYRPEDNMHPWKLQRLSRTIQSYLAEHYTDTEGDWQFDVVTVYVDEKNKRARVHLIEDVIL